MWGAQEKSGGTSTNFRPSLRVGIVPPLPHLQIASDATAATGGRLKTEVSASRRDMEARVVLAQLVKRVG